MKLLFLSNVSNSLIKFHRKSSSSVGLLLLLLRSSESSSCRSATVKGCSQKKGAGFSYLSGKMLNPTSISRFGSMHTNRILRHESRDVLQTIFFFSPIRRYQVLGRSDPLYSSFAHSKSITGQISIVFKKKETLRHQDGNCHFLAIN